MGQDLEWTKRNFRLKDRRAETRLFWPRGSELCVPERAWMCNLSRRDRPHQECSGCSIPDSLWPSQVRSINSKDALNR